MAGPALKFDDSAHRFDFVPLSQRVTLEFGSTWFFTSLSPGLPKPALESILRGGQSVFSSPLVIPGITFDAQAVALIPPGPAAEARFRAEYEFGFIQATRFPWALIEYWGKSADDGLTMVQCNMPSGFEIDTDPATQPWTHVPQDRFRITRTGTQPGGSVRLKITAGFSDHPMINFLHTTVTPDGKLHFLRKVALEREFRTLFVARHIPTDTFTAVSTISWRIKYDHVVTYQEDGARQSVSNYAGAPDSPRKGSTRIDDTDLRILDMAKAGGPFVTQAELARRLRSERKEYWMPWNSLFEFSGFWRTW